MQDKVRVNKDTETNTLTIERDFTAPKSLVWRAYAEKDWFEKWWGPEGWETTTKVFEFKPGGTIHYGMKCVDKNQSDWFGQESWGMMKIRDVSEPDRFAAQDYFSNPEGTVDETMPTQRFVVSLVENGEVTTLRTESVCETSEQLEQLVKMGMVDGFASQLNKLEALLSASA